MFEYINIICGVTGAAAAVISCIISIYTYLEAKKAQGDNTRKEITYHVESTLSSANEGVSIKKKSQDTDNIYRFILFLCGLWNCYILYEQIVFHFSHFRLFSYLIIFYSYNIASITMEKTYTKNIQ